MDATTIPRKLWEHPDPKSTEMWSFMQRVNQKFGCNLQDFNSLYNWSCRNRALFWDEVWQTADLIHEGSYSRVVDESIPISELPRWFEGIRVNWAENMLWSRDPGTAPGSHSQTNKEDSRIALTEVREGNTEVKHMTWAELRRRAAEMATALKERGVGQGDRVVVVGQHSAQTLIVLLAAAWLGAVFSSSSTDMGVGGLLQRTVQINPKFVFFDDSSLYNGKAIDLREKIEGVAKGLVECPDFKKVIVIQRFANKAYDTSNISNTERLETFLLSKGYKQPPPFTRVGFQDPLVVYYSSGTTGTPKAIVHGVGTLLLSGRKEGVLHREVTHNDVGLQFTTTGWIMYLSSVSLLLHGGRAVLYDGSPFVPDPTVLLRVVEQQRATLLGISPRWMSEFMKRKIAPREVADLSSLRKVVTTGMVCPDDMFTWFYDVGFPSKVQLSNISGGTDIAGCFGMENPLTPVYVGGCVGPSLAVEIAIFDHDLPDGSDGKPLPDGEAGDLVAVSAFPNIPLFLWNDDQPAPGKKYNGAYFGRYNRAWAQGDFAAIHPKTGAVFLLGRSDGVLNPSGIRFGSSDIYTVVERCFPTEVVDTLCVGQRRPTDMDENVCLFVIMKPGHKLDKAMVKKMKDTIGKELTKRHVPKYIFEIPEIPTTVNGKKVETPVKAIISGKTIKPSGTLLNPQSLEFFYRFQKIEELGDPQAKL